MSTEIRLPFGLPATLQPRIAHAARVAVLAVLAFNAALLAWFIAVGYRAHINSDAAVKSLLAQEMIDTGHVFPTDWNYVNGDLMVLFGQWFVLPFLGVMRNGYAAYAMSSLLSTVLVLLTTWWAARLVVPGKWPRLALIAILATGFSSVAADSLYGQVSYGNVYFLAYAMLALAWRAIVVDGRARTIACVALGVLSFGVAWSNPQRAAASHALPLFAAFALHALMAADHRKAVRDVQWPALSIVVGVIVGTLLHALTIVGVQNHLGVGHAGWLPYPQMQSNFGHALFGMLNLLGCIPTQGRPVVSLVGAWEALRLVAGLGALVLVPFSIAWSLRAARPASVRFFGAFTLASFALVFVLFVTTTLPDMNDPIQSSRYLLQPLLCVLVLVMGMVVDAATRLQWRALGAGVLLVLAGSALAPNNPIADPVRTHRPDARRELISDLRRAGLEYGYATYWNAAANTVVSGNRLRIRQIEPFRALPVPMRHLSSNRWYRPEAWTGRTFFLLTPAEAAAIDWNTMQRFLGPPERRFSTHGFDVVVYSRNPAGVLPGWSDFAHPQTLLVSPTSLHQVGRWESGTKALVADRGEAGALHFGPYLPMPAGRYEATFMVTCEGPAQATCGTVDATTDRGTVVFGKAPIPVNGTQPLRLVFDAPNHASDAELRVIVDGSGRVALRSITLRAISAN